MRGDGEVCAPDKQEKWGLTMRVANWPGSAGIRMVMLLAVAFVACAFGTGIAQAAVGVEDFSYADPGNAIPHQPTAPTGEKPQSKLWFNDGIWWGSIWSKTRRWANVHTIFIPGYSKIESSSWVRR